MLYVTHACSMLLTGVVQSTMRCLVVVKQIACNDSPEVDLSQTFLVFGLRKTCCMRLGSRAGPSDEGLRGFLSLF